MQKWVVMSMESRVADSYVFIMMGEIIAWAIKGANVVKIRLIVITQFHD